MRKIRFAVLLTVTLSFVAFIAPWPAHLVFAQTLSGNNAWTGNETHSGKETFTGPFNVSAPSSSANGISLLNPGVFTNTQMNEYVQSLIGLAPSTTATCTVVATVYPCTEFQVEQGTTKYASDGLTSVMIVPPDSTVFAAQSIFGDVACASTTTFCIGGSFQGHATATGTHINVLNSVFDDKGFETTGGALDIGCNVTNPNTIIGCFQLEGSMSVVPALYPGIHADVVGTGGFSSFLYQGYNYPGSAGYTLNSDTQPPTPLATNDFGTGHNFINFFNGSGGALGMQQGWTTTPQVEYFMQGRAHLGSSNTAYPIALNPLGGGVFVNGGTTIIYRCTVAGNLRVGQLTSVAADCGTAVDTGLRTN
jgi:hypothetical protein